MEVAQESLEVKKLSEFLDSNPWKYDVSSSASTLIPKIPSELAYLDHHLDPRLKLHHVVLAPSLSNTFASFISVELERAKGGEIILPDGSGLAFPRELVSPGKVVGNTARDHTSGYRVAEPYCAIASTLRFCAEAEGWDSVLSWEYLRPPIYQSPIFDNWGLIIGNMTHSSSMWPSLSRKTQNSLRRAQAHSGEICTWIIMANTPEHKQIIEDMGKPEVIEAVRNHTPDILGPQDDQHPIYGDADNSSVVQELLSSLRRAHSQPTHQKQKVTKARSRSNTTKAQVAGDRKLFHETILLQDAEQPAPSRYISDGDAAASLLNHAWASAVNANASALVITCGPYERIGVRDRETGTLYLSDPIDMYGATAPATNAIYTGVYLAMLDDAIERANRPRRRQDRPPRTTVARPSQPRTRAAIARAIEELEEHNRMKKLVIRELPKRKVAMLSFDYRAYVSASPQTFVRLASGETPANSYKGGSFGPNQCVHLQLTSEIQRGATGIAYTATLKLPRSKGVIIRFQVVVKLALSERQCNRLRKEFAKYQSLHKHKVRCIPQIYGLWEDVRTGALALVMDHVGISVLTLKNKAYSDATRAGYYHTLVVTPKQEEDLMQALVEIHNAGILHRDIRPENITMDNNGNVYFIDFDRSRFAPTDQEKNSEKKALQDVLRGHRNWASVTLTSTLPPTD